MTNPYPLPRQTRESGTFLGDGRASYGPFGFRIWDTADVVALVKRSGADAFTAEPVTVRKVGNENFDYFTATFSPALTANDRAVVRSQRLHERSTDVTRGGAISSLALERELSIIGTVLQELRRDSGGASIPGGSGAGSSDWSGLTGKPTTLAGFGITDAYTKAQTDQKISEAGGGGGDIQWSRIRSTPTTLAGYGITDGGAGASASRALRIANVWDYGAKGTTSAADIAAGASAFAKAGENQPILLDTGNFALSQMPINPYGEVYKGKDGTGFSLYQGFGKEGTDHTSTTLDPMVRIEKVSGANMTVTKDRVWDTGAMYVGHEKRAGNAFSAGLTSFAHHSGGENDLVAGHFRTLITTKGLGGRGWGLWAYTHNLNDTVTPWHAAEFNGCNQGADPGYLGQAQLLRLCMSDISADGNRMSSALVIGKSTHGGNNGFYTGIRVEADAVIPTASYQADGDAIRVDGPAAGTNTIGGLRFTGKMKFGLKTLEADIANGYQAAVWMAAGQKIVWGDAAGTCSIQSSPSADAIAINANISTKSIVLGVTDKLYFGDPANNVYLFRDANAKTVNVAGDGLGVTALSIGGAYISTVSGALNLSNPLTSTQNIRTSASISADGSLSCAGTASVGAVNSATPMNVTANGSGHGLMVDGTPVVGRRQNQIAILQGAANNQQLTDTLNAVVYSMRNHGLIG